MHHNKSSYILHIIDSDDVQHWGGWGGGEAEHFGSPQPPSPPPLIDVKFCSIIQDLHLFTSSKLKSTSDLLYQGIRSRQIKCRNSLSNSSHCDWCKPLSLIACLQYLTTLRYLASSMYSFLSMNSISPTAQTGVLRLGLTISSLQLGQGTWGQQSGHATQWKISQDQCFQCMRPRQRMFPIISVFGTAQNSTPATRDTTYLKDVPFILPIAHHLACTLVNFWYVYVLSKRNSSIRELSNLAGEFQLCKYRSHFVGKVLPTPVIVHVIHNYACT